MTYDDVNKLKGAEKGVKNVHMILKKKVLSHPFSVGVERNTRCVWSGLIKYLMTYRVNELKGAENGVKNTQMTLKVKVKH